MKISRRLFIYIMLIILGFAALLLLTNTLLLKPLYHMSVRNAMLSTMDSYSSIDYSADTDEWLTQLQDVSTSKSFDVIIRNENEVLYSSSKEFGIQSRPADAQNRPQGSQYQAFLNDSEDIIGLEERSDGTSIGIVSFADRNTQMMISMTTTPGGITIMLSQPLAPLNDSVREANILLAGCTILSLIILLFVVLKISNRFTKPIRQIQQTVGQIAGLNFEDRCSIKTGDELQSLGEDVNLLANELESALDELTKKNEQLEKDIEAQKKFIANASHELRTPLSLIKGYSDEMGTGYMDSLEKNKEYSKIIADEAGKMNRLLSEMLELSRMQSGQAKLKNEKLGVAEQIKSFVDKYDGFIEKNGLNISLDLDEKAVGYFDAVRFEQVLANYISNAARYGDEDMQVKITAQEQKSSIRISVFNSGRHIPEDKVESIWDGFYKMDDSRTRVHDSYGLGLSIVKAIQAAAGCDYGTKNTEGGVEFWFDVRRYNENNED
jgi:two-component system, OmpR family, sensor histidine kinase VanS